MSAPTHASAVETCSACPKLCRHACPVALADGRESSVPTLKMELLGLVRKGTVPLDSQTAATFWRCTGCKRSHASCELKVEKQDALFAARVAALEAGVAPPVAARLARRFDEHANPFGVDLAPAAASLATDTPGAGPAAGVLIFPGCVALRHDPAPLVALTRLLAAAGVPYRLHRGARPCTGYPLYAMGDLERFRANGAALAAELAPAGTILTPCPTCAWTLRDLFPRHGLRVPGEVQPAVVYVYRLLRSRRLSLASPTIRRLAYHDPCHLGRYLGVYDEPRRLLRKAGDGELREMDYHRVDAACCGAGGSLPHTEPATAGRIAQMRLEEFGRTGAEVLVTACPSCTRSFRKADPALEVRDVLEVLADAL